MGNFDLALFHDAHVLAIQLSLNPSASDFSWTVSFLSSLSLSFSLLPSFSFPHPLFLSVVSADLSSRQTAASLTSLSHFQRMPLIRICLTYLAWFSTTAKKLFTSVTLIAFCLLFILRFYLLLFIFFYSWNIPFPIFQFPIFRLLITLAQSTFFLSCT